jgi:CHAD domain-containing protein
MKNTNLCQSNTAALPPPNHPPLAAMLPGAISPTPLLPSSPKSILAQPPSRQPASSPAKFVTLAQSRIPKNPGESLARALAERWKQYCKQLRACRRQASEKHVHQLRVATRRLNTHFLLVERVTGHDDAPKAAKKLKRRLKILGKLRDAQVLKSFLKDCEKEFPEIKPVLAFACCHEQKVSKKVGCKVLGFKKQKLEKWTSAVCRELENAACSSQAEELLVRRVFDSLSAAQDEVRKCRAAINPDDSETVHRTRVVFKKLRYMVEAASPDFTGFGKVQLRRLAAYQRRMGELQDAEVLQKFVGEFLEANPNQAASLTSFRRYLTRHRSQKLRACLKHLDDLPAFNPAGAIHRVPAPRQAA